MPYDTRGAMGSYGPRAHPCALLSGQEVLGFRNQYVPELDAVRLGPGCWTTDQAASTNTPRTNGSPSNGCDSRCVPMRWNDKHYCFINRSNYRPAR